MVKLFENFWIKIVALIFGLLLWFHVATEKMYTYQLNLPISEIVMNNDLTLSATPPDSLMVTVTASGKQLMRKQWRDRGLKVIANQYPTGTHRLPLTTSNTLISSLTNDVSLDEINFPPNIVLQIDGVGVKKVPVEADITLDPDDGFAVSGVYNQAERTVSLLGPQSIIERIPVIYTEKKNLTGLRNSFELTLPLAIPSGYGIQVIPDSARFSIDIVPVKTRVFDEIPIAVYNATPENNLTLNPPVVRVELTGPPSEIDLVNRSALVASVDYKTRQANGTTKVKVDCPPKFKIKHLSDSVIIISGQ